MPVVTIHYDKLVKMLGREVSFEELAHNLIPMLGSDVERIDEREMVIETEFFPNRPDLYSVEGVARALKGFLGIETGIPEYHVRRSDVEARVEKSVLDARPCLAVAVVRGVEFEDERDLEHLMEFQEHLHWVIGRDRKKAAIGIHDFEAVEPPLRYFLTDPNDRSWAFEPLDHPGEEMTPAEVLRRHEKGRQYAHLVSDGAPILADEEGVISFPPVINSERTRVTQDTTDLLIDVTGTDWRSVLDALHVIVCNLAERGAEVLTVEILGAYERTTPTMELDVWDVPVREAQKLLGIDLSGEQLEELLERARHEAVFVPEGERELREYPLPDVYHIEADWREIPPILYEEDVVRVFVGPWRTNILHEWDLIEDAGIMYNYDRFEPTVPDFYTPSRADREREFINVVRDTLARMKFVEVNSLTLISPEENYRKMRLEPDGRAVKLANPIQKEYTIVRTWILPSLMRFLADNKHRPYPQRVFELGEVIERDEDAETGAKDRWKLALAIAGPGVGFSEIKSVAEALLRELDVTEWEVTERKHRSFINGRCAAVLADGQELGFFGEIHPEVLTEFDLEVPVVGGEFDVAALRTAAGW